MTTDSLTRAERDPAAVSATTLAELASTPTIDEERVAAALRSVLEADQSEAGPTVDALSDFATTDDMLVRDAKVRLVATVAAVAPDQVEPVVDDLLALLDNEFDVAHGNALLALTRLAEDRPDAIDDAVPTVAPLVDGDEPLVQARALAFLSTIAADRPAAVTPAISPLVSLLAAAPERGDELEREGNVPDFLRAERAADQRGRERLREGAADVLTTITGAADPGLEAAVPTLREIVAADSNLVVRRAACHLLWVVASEAPDTVLPVAHELRTVITDVSTETDLERSLLAVAVRTLALLADRDPTVLANIESAVPTLFDLLDADEAEVRAPAAGLLSYVAETDPEVVTTWSDALTARLEDDHPAVRASVSFALGAARIEAATGQLRRLHEMDPEASVQAAAADALQRLEDA